MPVPSVTSPVPVVTLTTGRSLGPMVAVSSAGSLGRTAMLPAVGFDPLLMLLSATVKASAGSPAVSSVTVTCHSRVARRRRSIPMTDSSTSTSSKSATANSGCSLSAVKSSPAVAVPEVVATRSRPVPRWGSWLAAVVTE